MEIGAFLSRYPPFDALEPEPLARIVAAVEIEHFAPGVVVLRQAGAPATRLYVVRRGELDIVDDGRVIDQVGEGEVFGMWSLLGHVAPSATVRATEDTLCYLIDAEVAAEVLGTSAGVAFVAASARRRISAIERTGAREADPSRFRSVGALVRRPPVTCDPDTTVSEAAELMSRERVSSLLVPSHGATGILTDRDLRTRVLAERRPPDTPVRDVMTPRAETVPTETMAGEVLLRMLEGEYHHVPVTDGGRVIGVVTDTDLMGVGRDTPFALKSAIARASDPDGVSSGLRELPRVVAALVDASADPVDVGHVVGFAIDAATRRLLELSIDALGEPPAAWAWLAMGSAARQEQALRTDQDHAIAFAGDGDPDPSLGAIAEAVTSGLVAGGIPRCEADAMATNPALRLPLPDWVRRFDAWMRVESPKGSEQLSIVFDYRQVAGPLAAEPALDDAMRSAPSRPLFLRHLARRALDERPPIGFVRDLVVEPRGEHAGTVDVKGRGITLIGSIARFHAVRSGVTAKRTLERLRGAEGAGAIDAETREELEESFRFLWEVRLRHHVGQHRSGRALDDFVDPDELGPVARNALKEAFRIVTRAQRSVALEAGLHAR